MMVVSHISKTEAIRLVVANHYMHRKPPISFCFGLFENLRSLGVITLGSPASRQMIIGACPSNPSCVVELNRLWVSDECPRNTETWFISRVLKLLPPLIILSYADTAVGHSGYVYRAANFYFSGQTDMDRRTPRFDYVPAIKCEETLFGEISRKIHSRDAFRNGYEKTVRRLPKFKYWTVTGNRRQRKELEALCQWPKMSWKDHDRSAITR